jgi:hypothetical protein
MPTLNEVQLTAGEITFSKEEKGRPATSETKDNVTINHVAIPGTPAHYEVTFMVSATFQEAEGLDFSNRFHLTCLVPEPSDRAQYRAVEDQAARQIAPMLRSLADKIEAHLPDFSQPPSDGGDHSSSPRS